MIAGFPFIASSFDPDARAFVQASGATDRAALNYFVKGIKRLGLWEDMVCWPLRSAQNAGTGSTAYSLGGLGTYNGTLVNGPTWGADGIEFADNTTQIITTTISPANLEDFVIFSVMQCNAGGSTFNVVANFRQTSGSFLRAYTFAQRWTEDEFRLIPFLSSGSWTDLTSSGFIDGSYHSATYRITQSTTPKIAGLQIDGGPETTSSDSSSIPLVSSSQTILSLGNEGPTSNRALSGNLPFAAYFKSQTINAALINSLYKSTLGQGLGLP